MTSVEDMALLFAALNVAALATVASGGARNPCPATSLACSRAVSASVVSWPAVGVGLEIEAHIPDGAPDKVQRDVTENARTLKFRAAESE
jgi:hypothetical protein